MKITTPHITSHLLLLLLLLLGSCSKDPFDDPDPVPPVEEEQPVSITDPIRFAYRMANDDGTPVTRMPFLGTTFPGGSYSLGMYMMRGGSTTTVYDNLRGNNPLQYSNLKASFTVSNDKAEWTSFTATDGETKLVPDFGLMFSATTFASVAVDFYAYHPHTAATAGHPLTAIPFDATRQDDVLFAYHKGYTVADHLKDIPVSLYFCHAFSLIEINLTNLDNKEITLEHASVSDLPLAATPYIYTQGTFDLAGSKISSEGVSCTTTTTHPGELTAPVGSYAPGLPGGETCKIYVLVPPVYVNTGGAAPYVRFNLRLGGNATTLHCDLPLPDLTSLDMSGYGLARGIKTQYTINLDAFVLSLHSFVVEPWEKHTNQAGGVGNSDNDGVETGPWDPNKPGNGGDGQGTNIGSGVEDWDGSPNNAGGVGQGNGGNIITNPWGDNPDNAGGNGQGTSTGSGVEDWDTGGNSGSSTGTGQGNDGDIITDPWGDNPDNSGGNGQGTSTGNGVEDWDTGGNSGSSTGTGQGNDGDITTNPWGPNNPNSGEAGQGASGGIDVNDWNNSNGSVGGVPGS